VENVETIRSRLYDQPQEQSFGRVEVTMKADAGQAKKRISISKFGCCGTVTLWAALLLALPSCVKVSEPAGPPPDLSRCTRAEIRYRPSILEYVFPNVSERENLLSPAELQYLQSLKTIVSTDREQIKALARKIALGSCYEPGKGAIGVPFTFYVVCYQNGERLTPFTIVGSDTVATEDGQWFRYRQDVDLLATLHALTPQIRPFQWRMTCAGRLGGLRANLSLFLRDTGAYPAPNKWCDAIAQVHRTWQDDEEDISRSFKCPSAGRGRSHYAMNPHCEPNTPSDTVLFFETKAGWNQHGGPELFTFDNHDPRGGCVKLNDGTVKFIRTEEELAQLRWK
jgi:hypothetical protein